MQRYDWPLMARLLMSTNEGEIEWNPCERKHISPVRFSTLVWKVLILEFAQFVQSSVCLCLKCCTKKSAPFIPAHPLFLFLLRLVSRRVGEREAVWLRCHCRLSSGRSRQPGGATNKPQQELGGTLGPDRGSLPRLPEWGPELRSWRCRHLHRLQHLLHWHGQ